MAQLKVETADVVSRLQDDSACKYGGIVITVLLRLAVAGAFRANSMLGIYAKMVRAWEDGRNAPHDEENPFDANEYKQRAQYYAWQRGQGSKIYPAERQYVLGKDKSADARAQLAEGTCHLKEYQDIPYAELYTRLMRVDNGSAQSAHVADNTPDNPWDIDDTQEPEVPDVPF